MGFHFCFDEPLCQTYLALVSNQGCHEACKRTLLLCLFLLRGCVNLPIPTASSFILSAVRWTVCSCFILPAFLGQGGGGNKRMPSPWMSCTDNRSHRKMYLSMSQIDLGLWEVGSYQPHEEDKWLIFSRGFYDWAHWGALGGEGFRLGAKVLTNFPREPWAEIWAAGPRENLIYCLALYNSWNRECSVNVHWLDTQVTDWAGILAKLGHVLSKVLDWIGLEIVHWEVKLTVLGYTKVW